jgi:FkbM family methyltransferase
MRSVLRRLVLRLLWLGRGIDFSIRHPWARESRVRLNLFRHKGYWYHGSRREAGTMALFQALLRPGQVAFDVGAHIGWITLWLAQLVGPQGRVLAFEPGSNNLGYLRRNVAPLPQVRLMEAAVGEAEGQATLFEESLTGQNNAIGAPYHRLAGNAAANVAAPRITERSVAMVTLDAVAARQGLRPDLVKIDVEGHEFAVLRGMPGLLAEAPPVLLLEITRDHAAILALLQGAGYQLFAAHTGALRRVASAQELSFNTLALHPSRHQAAFGALGLLV